MRKQEGLMYLVFDVGATFIKYALMDDEGNISGKGKTQLTDMPRLELRHLWRRSRRCMTRNHWSVT